MAVPLDAGLDEPVDEEAMYAQLLNPKQYEPRKIDPAKPVVIEIVKDDGHKEEVIIDVHDEEIELEVVDLKKGQVSRISYRLNYRVGCCGCLQ